MLTEQNAGRQLAVARRTAASPARESLRNAWHSTGIQSEVIYQRAAFEEVTW